MPGSKYLHISPPPRVTVELHVQKWNTDGAKVKLPKKFKLLIDIEKNFTIEQIHDAAMDAASDHFGWCINSCTLHAIYP
jgi:hypothetical protein